MPRHLHLDFESFSEAELNDVGAYRYAFDPSTEILCAAMALDNEAPVVWHPRCDMLHTSFEVYWDALEDPSVLIYAHNAQMEMAICQALLQKTWGITPPDLSRFRCTMSLARRAALPGSLDKLSEVLDLKNKKDKKGKALIRKFCVLQSAKKPTKKNPAGFPVRRIYPKDDPEAFNELLGYCQQDVRAEQEIAQLLAYFDEPINNANYTLDARINARGVPVNLDALRHAQTLIDEETEIVSRQFRELTGFNVTQNKVLLEWVNSFGHNLPDLTAETIDTFLDNLEGEEQPSVVVEALRMKQSVAFASIKKVATMLACAGPHDNRIRGMLGHHGATTGRWVNNLVQFQNMKRPADHMAKEAEPGVTWSEKAYQEICQGISLEMLRLCYGPPLEVISSCIRHFVHDV
jgi:DNA polymerase